MLLLFITYFMKRREDDEPDYNVQVKKHLGFRIVTIVTTVVAIILFLLTENMSLPMRLVDSYTLWHIVLAVVTLIFAVLSRKKYEDELNVKRA